MPSFRLRRPVAACTAVIASFAAILASPASAHDIVILAEWHDGAVQVDVKYGHPEDYQPIVADKLYRFGAFEPGRPEQSWRSGLAIDAMDLRMKRAPSADPASGVTLLTAQYDNGYWTKNDTGEMVNTGRPNNPKSTVASHNLKYGKALVATGPDHAGFDRVVGHRLELVPKRDPFTLAAGDALPVLVLFDGRPLAGAGVEIGDAVTGIAEDRIARYRTDRHGVAMVPVGPKGASEWAVLGVDHDEASQLRALADREKYTATLVFRRP